MGIEDLKKKILSVSMAITRVSKCLYNDCGMDTPKRFRKKKKWDNISVLRTFYYSILRVI